LATLGGEILAEYGFSQQALDRLAASRTVIDRSIERTDAGDVETG
jgi:hypothetical protein